MKALIIFKGWGTTDSLYKEVAKVYKKYDIVYYREGVDLSPYSKVSILAWSMGTLDAIKLLNTIDKDRVEDAILVSPTLNFMATTRPLIIKRMIKRLKNDKLGCLIDFSKLCLNSSREEKLYLEHYLEDLKNLSTKELIHGLEKLLSTEVEVTINISPTIILAKNDRLIIRENSQRVIDSYSSPDVIEIDGGHNLFINKDIIKFIKEIRRD